MLTHEERNALQKPLRILQMIVISLLLGVMSFGVVVLVLKKPDTESTGGAIASHPSVPIVSLVALAAGVAALLGVPLLMNIVSNMGRRAIARGMTSTPTTNIGSKPATNESLTRDLGRMFQLYNTRTMIAAAVLEGAALLNLVAYMQAVWMPNFYLIILLAVALAAQVPAMGRVERWLDRQQRLLSHDRLGMT